MEWHEVELDGSRTTQFPERIVPGFGLNLSQTDDCLGGIIRGGQWGWVTRRKGKDATLLICIMATGECVSRHCFWRQSANEEKSHHFNSIRCVEELFPGEPKRPALLAICLEMWDHRTQVLIYAYISGKVLRRFDLQDHLHCRAMTFLDESLCGGTRLKLFDGCLAVATEEGTVLLVDLNAGRLLEERGRHSLDRPSDEGKPSYGKLYCIPGKELGHRRIESVLEKCRSKVAHLAVQVDVASTGIRSLMGIPVAPGFAAGLEDGRIAIYDLILFQLTTTMQPPPTNGRDHGAVERMCLIMPPDDPKPCFYISALYQIADRLHMLLHNVYYRRVEQVGDGFRFEHFHSSSVRNHQIFDRGSCSVTACTTASTFSFAGDSGTLLLIISWYSNTDRKNKLVLFDINQWYKDEMPSCLRHNETPHYVAGYILSGLPIGLGLHLRSTSIMHYVSLQRYDEHFYPDSLTFDCMLLTATGSRYYAQDGVQNRFLNTLRWEHATLFLRPQPYHESIVRLRLLPQFCELSPNATFSKTAMYEVILSVALEHNCGALLNDCARSWMDGSFLCNLLDPTKLSLATLTQWIVRRAGHIKSRCSELCQGIFDYGGYSLDERERREFQLLTDQLSELLRLQSYIVEQGRRRLAPTTLAECKGNEQALRTVHEYQRVLYWFIEQGLLPEGQHEAHHREHREQPLVRLRHVYSERRAQRKTLYIDALIKHSGLSNTYPPDSLHALLLVMLAPDTEVAPKQALLLYLLLDLDSQLGRRFKNAFQLGEGLAKSVRSFWCLDRGDYEELYMHPAPASNYQVWQTRLLVETLLAGGAIKAAMRVVYQPPGPLPPSLHMSVLLANESMPQAFQLARLHDDEEGQPLLESFFRHCLRRGRFKALAELCLRGPEERLLYRLLRECRSRQADRVQLILLLQKSKFIDAVAFMDDVAAEREREDDSSSLIISAYRSTMAPVAQNIAGTFLRIRGHLEGGLEDGQSGRGNLPPFSCQLVKQNASGQVGGIFQSSAVSAHWATQFEEPPAALSPVSRRNQIGHTNIPFLRHAQYGLSELPRRRRTVRPVPHQAVEKRQREAEQEQEREREREQRQPHFSLQPCKRRRLLSEQLVDDVRGHVQSILGQQLGQSQVADTERSAAVDLLQPPTFLQTRQPTASQSSSSPQAKLTILKRNGTAPALDGEPVAVDTSATLAEPKRFRFKPPIPLRLDGSMEVDTEEEEQEGEEEETDEIIVGDDDDDVEFFSPLASANVSLVNQLAELPQESPARPELPPPGQPAGPPPGPQPRGSLRQGKIDTATESEGSSGFGSFATVQPTPTTSHSQFVPTICSSKMCETQSQVFSSGNSSAVKISERTTICGEMESTDLGSALTTAVSAQWSLPAVRPTGQAHHQMMDTTLGMSTYDVPSLEQQVEQQDQEEELKLGDTQSLEEEHDQEQGQEEPAQSGYQQLTFMGSSQEPAQEEPLSSPTYSLSSEESDMSSAAGIRNPMITALQSDDPMYSIVVESTGSITTSRSVTHTPTSFLPSDTNVSQTSTPPRPAHGGDGDGDGSPPTLYRANSLETVDDLDTTKGSLEEEEEYDEDDCVIALDGTEVRGYVARAQEAAACSSAELFAFKDKDGQEESAARGDPCPSLSLGATVNSDSEVADTIVIDSDDEDRQPEDQKQEQDLELEKAEEWPMGEDAPSDDSVATVAFSEHKQNAEVDVNVDVEVEVVHEVELLHAGPLAEIPEEDDEEEDEEETKEEEVVAAPAPHSAQEEDSRQSLTLVLSDEDEDEEQAAPPTTRTLRPRRSTVEYQDSPRSLRPRRPTLEQQDSPHSLRPRRSTSRPATPINNVQRGQRCNSLAPATQSPSVRRTLRGISEPPPMVVMQAAPKTRAPRSRKTSASESSTSTSAPASVEDSKTETEATLPRTRRTAKRGNGNGNPAESNEATTSVASKSQQKTTRGKRATSLTPSNQGPTVRQAMRGISEPPTTTLEAGQVGRKRRAAGGGRSRKTSSSTTSTTASPPPAQEDDSAAAEKRPRRRRTDQSANATESEARSTPTRQLRLRVPRNQMPEAP
ncbi:hypothetical protein M5D96_012490 [Drosophila gunungcola]|uniref:ELYS-like domain-containing protein n=1 Tax=Drosophila gunungcola TaxID=103775 RepID=A0A9Q0BJD5_9MUSC|nr:hypothetical protein M5D96_012490 [Drosophila gunungcola]